MRFFIKKKNKKINQSLASLILKKRKINIEKKQKRG